MIRWVVGLVAVIACGFGPGAALGFAQEADASTFAVATRDLPRGVALEPADVTGPADVTADVIGWVTRRVIAEGEPLRHPAIAPADIIRSGDAVQLVWSEGAVEIRLSGKALGSAAVGETLLVRVDTQRRFEGIAEAPGVVRLASH